MRRKHISPDAHRHPVYTFDIVNRVDESKHTDAHKVMTAAEGEGMSITGQGHSTQEHECQHAAAAARQTQQACQQRHTNVTDDESSSAQESQKIRDPAPLAHQTGQRHAKAEANSPEEKPDTSTTTIHPSQKGTKMHTELEPTVKTRAKAINRKAAAGTQSIFSFLRRLKVLRNLLRGSARPASSGPQRQRQPLRMRRNLHQQHLLLSLPRLLGATCSWATVRMTGTPYRP